MLHLLVFKKLKQQMLVQRTKCRSSQKRTGNWNNQFRKRREWFMKTDKSQLLNDRRYGKVFSKNSVVLICHCCRINTIVGWFKQYIVGLMHQWIELSQFGAFCSSRDCKFSFFLSCDSLLGLLLFYNSSEEFGNFYSSSLPFTSLFL